MSFGDLKLSEGNMPLWLLGIGGIAVFNTIQSFTSLTLNRRVYSKSPGSVNNLQSRTFGVWTLLAAFIRIYAAFDIHNRGIYNLTLASYFLAFGHFFSEVFIFKTAGLNFGTLSPFAVSSIMIYWMWTGYNDYVH